jgi:wyosine [tRNA(Phe)-imidazoG37] synthetase (radical SAM superfamily)
MYTRVKTLEERLKEIEGYEPQCDHEWASIASDIPGLHSICQTKAMLYFLVIRDLNSIEEGLWEFQQYLKRNVNSKVIVKIPTHLLTAPLQLIVIEVGNVTGVRDAVAKIVMHITNG